MLLLQSLRLARASHLPLHKGGSLPPDSTPKGVTHYTLRGKECEKEYEQNARTPFVFRQVLPLRVILSGVRPRSHLALLGAASQFDFAPLRSG